MDTEQKRQSQTFKQLADTWDQSDKEQVKKKEKPGHTEANKQKQLYKIRDNLARMAAVGFILKTQVKHISNQVKREQRGKLSQVQTRLSK